MRGTNKKPGLPRGALSRFLLAVGKALVSLAFLLNNPFVPVLCAQSATNIPGPIQAETEKERCSQNLQVIYKAISAYRADKKDLPNWFSDLVPNYLADISVLTCPVCLRTGQTEPPSLADPKVASSYLFEFCPLPLGAQLSPNAPEQTRREWKRRQMGLLGSEVPLVRCRHHLPSLNLSFDGRVYESPPAWENLFTNRVRYDALMPSSLFPGPARKSPPRFPPRDSKAQPSQIDLGKFYNVGLREMLHRMTNNTLANLPSGLRMMEGTVFDIRGVIQLSSSILTNRSVPAEVKGIPIGQKCARLHFLHAAGLGSPKDDGMRVGAYVLKFAGNNARLEIPLVYGRDVVDWMNPPGTNNTPASMVVAWTGTNNLGSNLKRQVRLFKTTWTNLAPDLVIESLDFVSANAGPAPFLVAITAE